MRPAPPSQSRKAEVSFAPTVVLQLLVTALEGAGKIVIENAVAQVYVVVSDDST